MTRLDELRVGFRDVPDKEAFLRAHSGLPGPRANLELAAAVAEQGDSDCFAGERGSIRGPGYWESPSGWHRPTVMGLAVHRR